MLTIYGVSRSRATRNIWLAYEANIPFKQVAVIQANRLKDPQAADAPLHSRSAAFLKINPNGHIPSIDDDGFVLHESLAINLYLAKKYGGALGPADVKEDGQMGMWSLWAATEVEMAGLAIQAHRGGPADKRDEKAALAAIETLRKPFAVLNEALAATGCLVGGRFTVADINVAECVRYAQLATELFDGAPRVKAWLEKLHARPAFQKMWTERNAEPA